MSIFDDDDDDNQADLAALKAAKLALAEKSSERSKLEQAILHKNAVLLLRSLESPALIRCRKNALKQCREINRNKALTLKSISGCIWEQPQSSRRGFTQAIREKWNLVGQNMNATISSTKRAVRILLKNSPESKREINVLLTLHFRAKRAKSGLHHKGASIDGKMNPSILAIGAQKSDYARVVQNQLGQKVTSKTLAKNLPTGKVEIYAGQNIRTPENAKVTIKHKRKCSPVVHRNKLGIATDITLN